MALLGRRLHCVDAAAAAVRAFGLLIVAIAAVLAPRTAVAQRPSLEYAVKANFLYKFGPFVQWPARAFADPADAFHICVVGEDPFGAALDDAVRGQAMDGHPVSVTRLLVVSRASLCHVLYVGRSPRQPVADVLEAVRGAPMLTVTDERFAPGGGIVHFMLRDGRVRFGIDVAQAETSGLIISSKLMALAVRPQGGAR